MYGGNRPACAACISVKNVRGKFAGGSRARPAGRSIPRETERGQAAPRLDAVQTAAPVFMPFAVFSCFGGWASERPPGKHSLLRRLWKKPAALRRPRPERPRAARFYRACAQAGGFFGRGSGTFRAGGRAASGQTAGCKALRFFVPWQNLYGEGSARPRTSGESAFLL